MGPTVETLVLHPAILIASGFESITSRQVRFLHAHRLHFHQKSVDLNETIVINTKDIDLGGILNPFGDFLESKSYYNDKAYQIDNFPYLTRREILINFYQKELNAVWSEIMIELFNDLAKFSVSHKKSKTYFQSTTVVIHELYTFPVYQKITALHLCGLGGKLMDAFSYVFESFRNNLHT